VVLEAARVKAPVVVNRAALVTILGVARARALLGVNASTEAKAGFV